MTSDEKSLLSKGLNFAMDNTQKDKLKFIVAIEQGIENNNEITREDKI